MARPRSKRGEAGTAERLLDVAEVEFARNGFAAARLLDISKQVGISRASLLYHYPSKEVLYQATVTRSFAELSRNLGQSILASGSFPDRLRLVTEQFEHFLRQRPALAQLIIREMLAGQGPGWDILHHQMVPLLDHVEAFIAEQGATLIPEGLPVRAAIMQVVSTLLLQNASGSLGEQLWGEHCGAWLLVQQSFLVKKQA